MTRKVLVYGCTRYGAVRGMGLYAHEINTGVLEMIGSINASEDKDRAVLCRLMTIPSTALRYNNVSTTETR